MTRGRWGKGRRKTRAFRVKLGEGGESRGKGGKEEGVRLRTRVRVGCDQAREKKVKSFLSRGNTRPTLPEKVGLGTESLRASVRKRRSCPFQGRGVGAACIGRSFAPAAGSRRAACTRSAAAGSGSHPPAVAPTAPAEEEVPPFFFFLWIWKNYVRTTKDVSRSVKRLFSGAKKKNIYIVQKGGVDRVACPSSEYARK